MVHITTRERCVVKVTKTIGESLDLSFRLNVTCLVPKHDQYITRSINTSYLITSVFGSDCSLGFYDTIKALDGKSRQKTKRCNFATFRF